MDNDLTEWIETKIAYCKEMMESKGGVYRTYFQDEATHYQALLEMAKREAVMVQS